MSIDSLRSGAIRICFDPSLNEFPNKCRILVEGQMLDTGTATPGELIKIPSLRDVDDLFGEGSIIAEGLRTTFGCCPQQVMEIFALPHNDDDVAAVAKAAYTIEFKVTAPDTAATSDGRVDFFMNDSKYNTSMRVTEGMTPPRIAAPPAAALNR